MKQKYFELLRKRQQGRISLQEDQELNQWMEAGEDNKSMAGTMDQIWSLSENFGDQATPDTEKALGRLMERIQSEKENTAESTPTPVRHLRRRLTWIAVAACLVLAMGLGWQFLNTNTPQWASLTTQATESSTLQLEDGTKVWINENSRLNFPQNIAEADRTLRLYGEAYFEVAPQKDRPFVVELNGAKVEVLGTAFNIRSYPNSATIEVTVSHGKVRVTLAESGESFELTDKMQFIFNRRTRKVENKKDQELWAIAWQTRVLEFDSTPLSEVLPALNRYYDVAIELENPKLNSCNFTLTITDQSVAEVLSALARSFGLQLKEIKSGKEYLISGESCE
jgi:transmembrane sensor